MVAASTRRYARNHVWAELVGPHVLIGLSARALEQLGEITDFTILAQTGAELGPGQCFASLESAKADVELFTPLSGTVTRAHEELARHPEQITEDCYGEGWMIELLPRDLAEFDALLDAIAYSELLKTATAYV